MAKPVSEETFPQISVVMSLYNSERYLRAAIDSVLSQTLTDFEFIIIDDGSTDGGADIVRSYEDARIHYIYQENAGLSAALNVAIAVSQSEIIARMDPDDICLPERFAVQYEYLQHHEDVVLVGSTATCIDAFGEKLPDIVMKPYYATGEMPLPEGPCIHPTAMFRRSVFQRAGGYPEDMRYGGEDAVLFNRMLAYGAVANLPDPLLFYRLHDSSMSHKSRAFNHLLRQVIKVRVLGESVSDAQIKMLADAYGRAGSGYYGYQIYVGKLFLRSGMAGCARGYFLKALRFSPLSAHAWVCLASSFIPAAWRKSLRAGLTMLKHGCKRRL